MKQTDTEPKDGSLALIPLEMEAREIATERDQKRPYEEPIHAHQSEICRCSA